MVTKPMSKTKPATVLVDPTAEEAEEAARSAVSRHKMLIIVGKCTVDYSGRAKSKLEPGERILIIKQDGTLLVHRSEGRDPVNWQPPGCIYHTKVSGKRLEIRAVRQTPPESIQVSFDGLQIVSTVSLEDEGEFSLYASEDDMHKAILLQPSIIEDGLKIISYEKKVEPGFVDVYGMDSAGRLAVIEVKRKTAGKGAVLQLAKYIDAVKRKADRDVRGILVAPNLGKGVQRVLSTLKLEFKVLDPKKCAEIVKRSRTKRLADFLKET
jgi:RecB family endonuclease NucS